MAVSTSSDRTLSVSRLVDGGFVEIDGWRIGNDGLRPLERVPDQRGVYAFAIGDQVRYVGLASRSIKQRLSHYVRPGPSQTTNIRLNLMLRELIEAGVTVRVFLAHPGDAEWRGLRMSGPEGLEAALIEDFELPWNKRGTAVAVENAKKLATHGNGKVNRNSRDRLAHGALNLNIIKFVAKNPGATELEIAQGIYGRNAVQPQVNQHCRRLTEQGLIERRFTRPFTYVIKSLGKTYLEEMG